MSRKLRVHRLSLLYTRAWVKNPDVRKRIAAFLRHERYPREMTEIVVVGPTCTPIGIISPGGAIQMLQPPQPRYPMWRIDNKPNPADCHCATFYEPDIAGPWSLKKINAHHRFCQYHPKAVENFNREVAQHRAANPDVYAQMGKQIAKIEAAEDEAMKRQIERANR